MMPQQFDVFLCHNSEDKPTVIQIAEQLRQYNLKPWLDQWELRPGTTWQLELERQIRTIRVAAAFVGRKGLGPWQREEIYSLLQQFVQRGCLVIPVLLPDAPRKPDLPIFLTNRMWVDFRVTDPNPVHQLVWGITGRKPTQTFTPPLKPTSSQSNIQNPVPDSPGTIPPLGQSLTSIWQTLGKKVDEYVANSVRSDVGSPTTPTPIHASSLSSSQQSSLTSNSAEMNSSASLPSNGGNYSKLQNLLRAGRWRDANQETTKQLCDRIGRKQDNCLRVDDIKNIPVEDLQRIDRLWMQYSQGKFGFTVQQQIWQECGNPVDSGEKWDTFGDRVGWCKNGKWLSNTQLIYDLQTSPVGELPKLSTDGVLVLMVRVLFKRFQS